MSPIVISFFPLKTDSFFSIKKNNDEINFTDSNKNQFLKEKSPNKGFGLVGVFFCLFFLPTFYALFQKPCVKTESYYAQLNQISTVVSRPILSPNTLKREQINRVQFSKMILDLLEQKPLEFKEEKCNFICTCTDGFFKLKIEKPPLTFTYDEDFVFEAKARFENKLDPFGSFSWTPSTRGQLDFNAENLALEQEFFFEDLANYKNICFIYKNKLQLNQWVTYFISVIADCPRTQTVIIKHSSNITFPMFHEKYNLTLDMASLPPKILDSSKFSVKFVNKQGGGLGLRKIGPQWHFLFFN